MSSSFFGLDIAVRGLFTSQRGLYVTNHNITNVNTPGYSRQVAVQKATRPASVMDGTGMVGTGSEVISIERIRDQFQDYKYWSENVALGEWTVKSAAAESLEAIFSENDMNGSALVLNEFFESLNELASDPSSLQVRELVKSKGLAVCKYLNETAQHLSKARADNNHAVKIKVDEVNLLVRQIRDVNKQIYRSELDGSMANDLRDQRTVLVDKLSKIVNIEVNEVIVGYLPDGKEDKHFQITLNELFLVNHYEANELEYYSTPESMYDIRWQNSGNKVDVKSGELKGYIDIRDGDGTDNNYKGVPYYIDKLNTFARTFAKAFNEGIFKDDGKYYTGHAGGLGLNDDTGIRFFSYKENGIVKSSEDLVNTSLDIEDIYNNLDAYNISLSADIMDHNDGIYKIAASSLGGNVGNNANINELIKMRHDIKMFAEGAVEDYMKSLVANLGIDAQYAMRIEKNQSVIVEQIENRRLSVSEVSLDEEISNMVKYMQAYNAAAKMISIMDEIYNVTINRMGMTGR